MLKPEALLNEEFSPKKMMNGSDYFSHPFSIISPSDCMDSPNIEESPEQDQKLHQSSYLNIICNSQTLKNSLSHISSHAGSANVNDDTLLMDLSDKASISHQSSKNKKLHGLKVEASAEDTLITYQTGGAAFDFSPRAAALESARGRATLPPEQKCPNEKKLVHVHKRNETQYLINRNKGGDNVNML